MCFAAAPSDFGKCTRCDYAFDIASSVMETGDPPTINCPVYKSNCCSHAVVDRCREPQSFHDIYFQRTRNAHVDRFNLMYDAVHDAALFKRQCSAAYAFKSDCDPTQLLNQGYAAKFRLTEFNESQYDVSDTETSYSQFGDGFLNGPSVQGYFVYDPAHNRSQVSLASFVGLFLTCRQCAHVAHLRQVLAAGV